MNINIAVMKGANTLIIGLITTMSVVVAVSCEDTNTFPALPKFSAVDSVATARRLLGTWEWTYSACCGEGTKFEFENTEHHNFTLSIGPQKILVYMGGELKRTSDWSLRRIDRNSFSLKTNPGVPNTGGRILFATEGGMLLFNDSYIDLSDEYFKRVPVVK